MLEPTSKLPDPKPFAKAPLSFIPPTEPYAISWQSVALVTVCLAFIAYFTAKGWDIPNAVTGILGIVFQSMLVHKEKNA
jgi:hypothetical protein